MVSDRHSISGDVRCQFVPGCIPRKAVREHPFGTQNGRVDELARGPLRMVSHAVTETCGMGHRGRRLLASARGAVVETGAGTGAKVPHHPREAASLVLARPTAATTSRLRSRERTVRPDAEIAGVLPPNGQFRFCQHVRSDDPAAARWQDRLAGQWPVSGQGCRGTRRTLSSIETFRGVEVDRGVWQGMSVLVRPSVIGRAVDGGTEVGRGKCAIESIDKRPGVVESGGTK